MIKRVYVGEPESPRKVTLYILSETKPEPGKRLRCNWVSLHGSEKFFHTDVRNEEWTVFPGYKIREARKAEVLAIIEEQRDSRAVWEDWLISASKMNENKKKELRQYDSELTPENMIKTIDEISVLIKELLVSCPLEPNRPEAETQHAQVYV